MKKQIVALTIAAIGLLSIVTSCEYYAEITAENDAINKKADVDEKTPRGYGNWPINWKIISNSNPDDVKIKFIETKSGYKRNDMEITVGERGGELVLQHQYVDWQEFAIQMGAELLHRVENTAFFLEQRDEKMDYIEHPDKYHIKGSWYEITSQENRVTFKFGDSAMRPDTCEYLRFGVTGLDAYSSIWVKRND